MFIVCEHRKHRKWQLTAILKHQNYVSDALPQSQASSPSSEVQHRRTTQNNNLCTEIKMSVYTPLTILSVRYVCGWGHVNPSLPLQTACNSCPFQTFGLDWQLVQSLLHTLNSTANRLPQESIHELAQTPYIHHLHSLALLTCVQWWHNTR